MKKSLWLIIFLFAPFICFAHTVILDSGEKLECDEIRHEDGVLTMLWKADTDEAEYDYERAVSYPFFEVKSVDGTPIDKTGKAVSYYLLGHKYLTQNDYKTAIELYESAIRLEPPYSDVILDIVLELMVCYNFVGRVEDSIIIGERTAANLANSPELHFNLGVAYALSHKDEEAITHYKKAASLLPTFGIAYGNLGILYYDLGSYREAKENLLKAKELLVKESNSNASVYSYYNEKELLEKVDELLDKISN